LLAAWPRPQAGAILAGVNWSGIDNHSLLGAALRLPLRLIPPGARLRIRRGPARGLRWIVGSANHGCWLGTYELDKQAALTRFVQPGMTVYDVGAQAGFYTLFFSRLVGPSGHVYAFEPLPINLAHLVSHVRMNGLENVSIVEGALWRTRSLASFSVDQERSMNAVQPQRGTGPLFVPTLSVDEMVRDGAIRPPDLVKMDVEGAEAAVLEGMEQTVAATRPILFIALHGESQRTACERLLHSVGYEINDLSGRLLRDGHKESEILCLPGAREPAEAPAFLACVS
jgi:FkbM family methyltransferase